MVSIKAYTQSSQAINCDGVNDFVDPNTLVTTVYNDFTFEVWARPTSTHEVDPESMSDQNIYVGLTGQKYLLWPTWRNSEAGVGISVGTNGVSVYQHGSNFMHCLLAWEGNLTNWTHIAVTIQNKQPLLYINGVLVKTGLTSLKNKLYPSLGECNQYGSIIGGIGGGSYGYYKGEIDEFRIWKTIRSSSEINSNMNFELLCPQGLLAYYKFNNGIANATNTNATTALDYSGNNYTAQLFNFSLNGSVSNWINPGPVLGILGGPISISSISGGFTVCSGQSTTLSVTGASSYLWNNGSTSSSIVVNSASTSVYSVVSAPSPCGTSSASVTVNVLPELNLSQATYSMCFGQSVTLVGNGTNLMVFSAVNNSVAATVSPSITTNYTVLLSNNGLGYNCSLTVSTQVVVHQNPKAQFSYTINPCGGGVYFSDSSQSFINGWLWTLSSTQTSSLQNPYCFYHYGGKQTVQLLVTNNFGCNTAVQKTIDVGVPPLVSISQSVQICKGSTTQLVAEGGFAYEWNPDSNINSNTLANPMVSPTSSTEYSVMIRCNNSTSSEICNLLLTVYVQVNQLSSSLPFLSANASTVVIGNAIILNYNGDEGARVSWLPETTPSSGYTVQAFPNKATIYTVSATRGACTQTFEISIKAFTAGCEEQDFFVPTFFTPNGDGQNDVLFLRGIKVVSMHLLVYNRWGELIFESSEQNRGWDGTYKSVALDAGVFAWFAEVQCVNGGKALIKGNVTLLR